MQCTNASSFATQWNIGFKDRHHRLEGMDRKTAISHEPLICFLTNDTPFKGDVWLHYLRLEKPFLLLFF